MRIVRKNTYVIVFCEHGDVIKFNRKHGVRIPVNEEYEHISFAFKKFSGDLLRVIPNSTRNGDIAWEKLRDHARNYWRQIDARA